MLFLGRHNQELDSGAISDNADRFRYDQKKFEEPQPFPQFHNGTVQPDRPTRHTSTNRDAPEQIIRLLPPNEHRSFYHQVDSFYFTETIYAREYTSKPAPL